MSRKKDGGPAFATPDQYVSAETALNGEVANGQTGISARDYFAAAALAGLLSGLPAAALGRGKEIPGQSLTYAAAAYVLADAMLVEREKK